MKHLKSHRSKHRLRNGIRFCRKNGQLLFLLLLIALGALLGCTVFSLFSPEKQEVMASLLSSKILPTDFVSGCSAMASAFFGNSIVLILLFLFGLTAYGCPLILIIPLFYGFCIGTAECQAYLQNGIYSVFWHALLPMSIGAVAVVIATSQALKMSCVFTRQLLPGSAHCGGMWQPFKLYVLRFLLCVVIALAAAVTQVLVSVFL